MKRLLKRINENTEMLPKMNFVKYQQSVSPTPSLFQRPFPPFPLLGRAPFLSALFYHFPKNLAQTRLIILLTQASPAIHRPLGPRRGPGGSPERRGEGARRQRGSAAAAAAASTAASAWCILLPPSPPPPSPGQPTQHPHPGARTHPHPPLQAPSSTRGAPRRVLRPPSGGSRAAEQAGQGKTTPLGQLRPRRPRVRCGGSRLPAPHARPPRHRKCRRLGSPHIQFKLSPPPPPPLPPGPPPPRPGPFVAPAPPSFAAAPRLAPGRYPRPARRPQNPPASRPADPSRDGPKLRLTHGAAVDAPLLSSSGSRTDRHPLPPPRPAREQRSPPILQSRLRRFRGVAARRRCPAYADDRRRTPPLALA